MSYSKVTSKWLKFLSGPSWGLLGLLLVLMLTVSNCSPVSNLASKVLLGGSPNVAANTLAGKTNTQTVGVTKNVAPTVSLRPQSRVETIDQRVTTENDTNPVVWLVLGGLVALAMFFLYLLPSPVRKKDS